MKEYKIEVRKYMTKKSTPDFTFMAEKNNDIPMPLMIMYGVKLKETRGMVYMRLHGDIKQRITQRCMCCGITITNPVSQYFGMGPVCGDHNYVNPFETEEELQKAVAAYRQKLVNTVWAGWIIKSAIISIDDDTDVYKKLAEMPIEVIDTPENHKVDGEAKKPAVFEITARIDTPERCTDDFSVYLSFDYNPNAVAAVKALRARYWSPEAKVWEIEYKELAELQKALPNVKFNIQNEEILPKTIKVEDGFQFKTVPMQHQTEGIQYGLEHSRWLLADEQGLGKTKQIIDLAVIRKKALGFKHCLIICGVNSLKWNWVEEIAKHSNESSWVLGQYTTKRSGKVVVGGTAEKLSDLNKLGHDPEIDSHYFIITNIESLRNIGIAAKLKELCEADIINMVAVDEIHRAKNLNTQQGEGMMQLQPDIRVAITGTPLINNPLDLYAILKWLGYQRYSFYSFREHFCHRDEFGAIVGYKNIDQLKAQLGAIMLRRTKKEVMPYLPEKIYKDEYVELTDEQKAIYNKVIDGVIEDETLATVDDCELVLKLRLRQISGGIAPFGSFKKVPKLDRMEQLVEEAIYSGTKVVIYSNWVEGLAPAIERLSNYNYVVVDGETADVDRQPLIDKFQDDPEVKIILGTIGALGTGFTITAATEVIFLDEPWNDATKEQAIDRTHRYGTKSAVTIHTLMSYGTYDEEVHSIITGKRQISARIVDRKDFATWKVA